jgi:hypothetical protein
MATDYDAPRTAVDEPADRPLDGLPAVREDPRSATLDVDEHLDVFVPPSADIDDDLMTSVVPMRADEFRCGRCFLLHHRSRLAGEVDGELVCTDCR